MMDSNNHEGILHFPKKDERPEYNSKKEYVRDEKAESERFRRYLSHRNHKAHMFQSKRFRM